MSKIAKENAKKARAKKKAARKASNYLRFGPKAGHIGKRQKRNKNRGPSPTPRSTPILVDRPKGKTKAKVRRTSPTRKVGISKYPLRPLRRRRQLGCPSREERGLSPSE